MERRILLAHPMTVGWPAPAVGPIMHLVRTILYVDDHADSLARGRALLATNRRSVIGAGNGRDALALAREAQPDLILLDLHLPDVCGVVVLHRLQEDPETSEIPVIVVSSSSIEDMPAPPRGQIGAYVRKPMNPPEFLRLVDQTLAELPERASHLQI